MRSHPTHPCPPFSSLRRAWRRLVIACVLVAAASIPELVLAQAVSVSHEGASLVVQVSDESGGRLVDARVSARRGDSPRIDVPSSGPGQFRLAGLPPGTYVVNASHEGFLAVEQRVSLANGHESRLDVVLGVSSVRESVTAVAPIVDSTTLKLPASLHDTPRSLTVVGADRMRQQNFRNVNDAIAYVPGMSVNSHRTGGYHFYARGYRMLPNDTRVDGMAGLNAGGGFGASLFGIEEAVFLRGPAGLLYGSAASPGGLINLVTKKPQDLRLTQVDVRASTFAGRGLSVGQRAGGAIDVDSTGSLHRGRLLYRGLASLDRSDYFTAGVRDDQRHLQGALTVRADRGGRTSLTPIARWSRQSRPAGGGIVVSPSTSLLTNDGVSGPINRSDLSPLDVNLSDGDRVDETVMTGADLRTQPGRGFTLSSSYRFIAFDTASHQFSPQVTTAAQRALLQGQGLVQRVESKSDTERRVHGVDVTVTQDGWQGTTWKTLLQAGAHGRREHVRAAALTGPAPVAHSPLDVFTGRALAPLVPSSAAMAWGAWSDASYVNGFVQGQASLLRGRIVTTVGVGMGRNALAPGDVRTSGPMPNASVVVNLAPQWALYASHATSFNPVDADAEDAAGRRGTFDPTRGTNLEAGVKVDTADCRYSLTTSVFRNEVGNALVQSGAADLNPNGNRYYQAAGTRRSRGIEFTVEARPVPAARVHGSFTLLDAVYTGEGPASASATVAIPGSRAEKSPRIAGSLWAFVQPRAGRFSRVGLGGGLVYQGERLGGNGARTPSAPDPLMLPASARIDLTSTYRISDRIDLAVHVENALDALVFVSGSVGSALEVASPRAVMVRVGARLFR